MDGGSWWATVHGVAESQTQLSDFTFIFHFHALEKEMATHSSVLAWRIPGMEELGGLPSMGSHRIGHDWSNLTAAAADTDDKEVASPSMLGDLMVLSRWSPLEGSEQRLTAGPEPSRPSERNKELGTSICSLASTRCQALARWWGHREAVGTGSDARLPDGSASWLCYFLAVWPWTGQVAPPGGRFLTCKIESQ